MNTFEVILIIALVLGVIGSNLALLKYSNKFKLPPNVKKHFEQPDTPPTNESQKTQEQNLSEKPQDDEKSQH